VRALAVDRALLEGAYRGHVDAESLDGGGRSGSCLG